MLIASIATNIKQTAEKEHVSYYMMSQIDRLLFVVEKMIIEQKLKANEWAGK
jgi:hypothetical protein